MGESAIRRYTALPDPRVDQIVENHMQRIVSAVLENFQPAAIVLRGSFGRGEGSVLIEAGHPTFLSDYEIDVASYSPFHRSLFARLTRELSKEFGMDVGLRWVRPDYMVRDRLGPFPTGKPPITTSLYESRYGSCILYGEDIIHTSPPIDPNQILLTSGLRLVLNRMAESLIHMPLAPDDRHDGIASYRWINKTLLSCAEALLLVEHQYHYSYAERGRRFARLAAENKLDFMGAQADALVQQIARATEFKLRPARDLYTLPAFETWLEILPHCDCVFRYLSGKMMQTVFQDYSEFPGQFLRHKFEQSSSIDYWSLKFYEVFRALRARRFPGAFFSPFHASHIVYACVPVLFFCYSNIQNRDWAEDIHRRLSVLGQLEPLPSDPRSAWDFVRRELVQDWKIFCC